MWSIVYEINHDRSVFFFLFSTRILVAADEVRLFVFMRECCSYIRNYKSYNYNKKIRNEAN